MLLKICKIPECGKMTETPMIDYCATHNREQRKMVSNVAKETEKRKNKKPIKPLSDKRKKDNLVYMKRRRHYLEKYPFCQLKLVGCTNTATEIHHVNGRIGSNLTNTNGFKSACHSCHRQLHDKISAKEARAKGLKGDYKPLTDQDKQQTENLF